MKEKKEKCKLCKKLVGTGTHKFKDSIHVKNGDWLDEIFHKKCFDKFKIDYPYCEER